MDLNKLYKHVANFERRTLQLDDPNDGFSEADVEKLSEDLDSVSWQLRKKYSGSRIKNAQANNGSDPFYMPSQEINSNTIDEPKSTENKPKEDTAKEQVNRVRQEFEEAMTALGKPKPYASDDWFQHYTFEERQLFEEIQQLAPHKPNFNDKLNQIDSAISTIKDKEVENFYAKEQEEKVQQQKAIQGKTPFVQQDASIVVRDSMNEIKAIVAKLKASPATVNFIFYNNGNVGITSSNMNLANAIRRNVITPMQMSFKHYMMSAKKYFNSATVAVNINV